MSTQHDPDRLIRAFLDEGQTVLPERTYDAVRGRIERTRQRVAIGPWRERTMTTIARIAVAAAAVLVLAVGASQLIPRDGGSGGAPPSPSPTLSASPSGSAAAPQPTTMTVDSPFPVRVTVQLGDDWSLWGDEGAAGKGWYKRSPDPPGMGFTFWTVENVFATPCGPTGGMDPAIGSGVDDLADALVAQPGTVVDADRPVVVDGYTGRFLDYTADLTLGNCDSGHLNRWTTVSDGTSRQALDGEHDQVWILDVDGQRIVIDAFDFVTTSDADRAELAAVIDTVRIDPN